MSFIFVPRINHGFVQIFIFWFILLCDSAGVQLQTNPQVETSCGENVTLTCNFSFSNQENVEIFKFQWLHEGKNMCEDKENDMVDLPQCESINTTSHQKLTLILTKIKPIQEGQYLCKIQTSKGIENSKANVVVKDCYKNSTNSMNDTHATCSFKGIYPGGVVHWFQGDIHLTNGTSTQEERDQDGFYDFQSTVKMKGKNLNKSLSCSLWIPSSDKYVGNVTLEAVSSSGRTIKLQWVCVLVEIIMMSHWM